MEEVKAVVGQAELITGGDLREATGKSKNGKATGPSGVLTEMLKASGEVEVQWVTELCNRLVKEGAIPSDWKRSWVVSRERGDAMECSSYRGMKLLDQVMKLFERIIEKKVRRRVEVNDMQFGFRPGKNCFRPGRVTTDAIFIVCQIQESF